MLKLNGSVRKEAKQARVKYEDITDGPFPGEVIVTFSSSKGKLTAIFPSSSVDKATGTITAYVIGEQGNSYLVDLPTYTLTSGSKAWLSKDLVLL